MFERIARYAAGSVRFEVTGGRGERFLNLCAAAGIAVEEISATPTGYLATAPLRDYKHMHRLARKNRCTLRVREKTGAYFAFFAYRHRWGIVLGLVAAVLLLSMCRNLIWNICFYDFTPAEEARARAELFEKGIYEGAFQSGEKLMRTAKEMFSGSREYGWVSLNFVHGRLIVEKTDMGLDVEYKDTQLTNIVAASDGIIRRIDLFGGYPQKTLGQSVAQGEVLVSSMRLSVYERPLYSRADAHVYAEVEKTYQYTQPLQITYTAPAGGAKRYYRLYLPWGDVALHGDIEVPEGAARCISRTPAAPFGFHLPALVEETEIRETQEITADLSPALAADMARVRIFDAIEDAFGAYELLACEEEIQEAEGCVTLAMHVKMLVDIAESVPYTAPTGADVAQ